MGTETVTLWTRQVPEVWEEIERTGLYRVKEEYIRMKNDTIADYYLKLYRWYTFEARNYAEIPTGLQYPIWLCVSEETMLQPIEDTIILKLEVPKDKVVFCNMEAWGYVVNYWYVPLDEEDEKQHAEELRRYGISEEDELISTSKGNFYPMLKRKIIDSWKRVFTMPPANDNDAVATIWEIRQEWVKEVRHYEASQPGENEDAKSIPAKTESVTMWTAQTQEVLDAIQRDGVSYVKKEYIKRKYGEVAWIFETAYDYFIRKFEKKVKKPAGAESPVWLFKDSKWAGSGQGAKLIELEIPAEEMIFFDRSKWAQVLNLSFIGLEKEREEFEKNLAKRGISDVSDVFAKPYYPMLKNQVMESWESLFDTTGLGDENLQGAVWCLKKEWVKGMSEQ